MEKPVFKSKEEFIAWFQKKTKQFAIDVIKFCRTFPPDQAARVILIKSSNRQPLSQLIIGHRAEGGLRPSFIQKYAS